MSEDSARKKRMMNEGNDPPRLADDTMVCRCEEILASDIRVATGEGASTINDVKRRTRAGMGVCQGIFCTRTISEMLVAESGIARNEILPMTARPPVRVVPLGVLAESEG